MKHQAFLLWSAISLFCSGLAACGNDSSPAFSATGWVIGTKTGSTSSVTVAKILKTTDSGLTWTLQTTPSAFTGMQGNDISAVSRNVAWAALGSAADELNGAIACTTDGGTTWQLQNLPQTIVNRHMKAVKGISESEAWAVSLQGDLIHTVNGGSDWTLVPVRRADGQLIPMHKVNRMDVIGSDIWIVNIMDGGQGVVHSADGGFTWRREFLPDITDNHGPLAISAFSSKVAWAAVQFHGNLWWTDNGGMVWNKSSKAFMGLADYDDICASDVNTVWAVVNKGFGGGMAAKVVSTGGEFTATEFNDGNYMFEGITTVDNNTAWLVGMKSVRAPAELPQGIIYATVNGGKSWRKQSLPENGRDIDFWKISFVGARR